MISALSNLVLPNANPALSQAPGATGASFEQALSAGLNPLQQVPVVGSIFRAIVDHPLAILGAAAQGFLAGGPVGAAAGAGLTVLSDQVSGDSTVLPRTEALLKAYGPLASS